LSEKVGNRAVPGRVDQIGSDLGEWSEDEAALVHGGMWQREFGIREDQIFSAMLPVAAVEEQVEVDDAWTLGGDGGAVPAHAVLDGEEAAEEGEWVEVGFEQSGCVGEVGLVLVAHGRGGVEAGDRSEGSKIGEAAEGFAQVRLGITVTGWQVGA
jgi:hypothetical protein